GEVGIDLERLLEVLLGLRAVTAGEARHLEEHVAGEDVRATRARVELEQDVELLANRRQEEERAEHALGLTPARRVDRVPEVRVDALGRELDRPLADL